MCMLVWWDGGKERGPSADSWYPNMTPQQQTAEGECKEQDWLMHIVPENCKMKNLEEREQMLDDIV
jgi:hypothetical protein